MSRAKLEHADLTSAKLRRAYVAEADLRFAKLRDAFLWSANFNGSDLRYADLTSASLNYTSFGGTNLDGTIGLDTTLHQGPSFLDIQTIYKSHGCIPEAFLRGVGAPEPFIAYLQSMAGPAIQLYSCFISYSTRDQEFGDRLYADLQANGVRCWFAAHHVKGGRKMHEQIDEAIRVYDRLLVILSEHSMNSEWVKTEISNARQREIREKRQMLFPISLVPFEKIQDWKAFDVDTGKDSAREIREYFIPDFSNWKDTASYAAAFQRLLRDLKAEGGTGGSGR